MNIINMPNARLTKDEAAKVLGLQTYDTALPQQWLDDLLLKLSIKAKALPDDDKRRDMIVSNWKDMVVSGLVWCYRDAKGESSLFGFPVALTVPVLTILSIVEEVVQDAVIETRETYVISGSQPVRDVMVAIDQEQAEMMFRVRYPGVLITSIQTKETFNASKK